MSEKIGILTDENWEKEVLASPQPVLVDFWAEWCRPCLAMAPDLEAVAERYDGKLRVGKLNVEENAHTPYRYNITTLPTLMVFKGGRVSEQRVGRLSRESLIKLIEPHLS